MRLRLSLAFALLAALCVAGSAFPVVGGAVDSDHTYVGAALQPQVHNGVAGTQLCSGALVSTTVFVTAAHCFPENGSTVNVTFATDFRSSGAVFYAGTVQNSADADIAVIVFGSPITDIGLAELPTLGFDETLPNNQVVDVVGYGVQSFDHRTPLRPAGSRQMTTTTVKSAGKLEDQSLKLLADPGACFGDSGGPNLVHGTSKLAAITTVGNDNCKGVSFALRVDTPVARDFLGKFVSLP
jgi:secreted trypsin-like serine protease